jgi:hypothetical protein
MDAPSLIACLGAVLCAKAILKELTGIIEMKDSFQHISSKAVEKIDLFLTVCMFVSVRNGQAH